MTTQSGYIPYSMPRQKLSNAEKTASWGKQNVDSIQAMSSSTMHNGRTSKYNKQVNFDLFNSRFDETDFDYVLDPYGNPKVFFLFLRLFCKEAYLCVTRRLVLFVFQ